MKRHADSPGFMAECELNAQMYGGLHLVFYYFMKMLQLSGKLLGQLVIIFMYVFTVVAILLLVTSPFWMK